MDGIWSDRECAVQRRLQVPNDSGESKHAKVAWDEAKLALFYAADVFRKFLPNLHFNEDDDGNHDFKGEQFVVEY